MVLAGWTGELHETLEVRRDFDDRIGYAAGIVRGSNRFTPRYQAHSEVKGAIPQLGEGHRATHPDGHEDMADDLLEVARSELLLLRFEFRFVDEMNAFLVQGILQFSKDPVVLRLQIHHALRSGEECIGKVSNVFRADHGGFRFGRTRKEGPRPLYIVLLPADFAANIG